MSSRKTHEQHSERAAQFMFTVVAICLFFQAAHAQKKAAVGTYRITGTAVNAVTGLPLDRASISIVLSKDFAPVQSMQTNADGHFEFDQLPAAKYALSGSRRGFITAAYDEHDQYSTAIVTGDGLVSENLLLRLVPDAVISGTVMEDSGDPVENAKVSLYRQTHDSGTEKVQLVSSANVDDTGVYEFSGLAPGDYFLSAGGRPWYSTNGANAGTINGSLRLPTNTGESSQSPQRSPLDLVYATVFYADVTNADDATPIPLKGADRLQINFSLHPVPALHLIVHVPVSRDPHGEGFQTPLPVLSQEIFGITDYVNADSRYLALGQTEISIPPGQYQVHINGGGPGSSAEHLTTVDVSSSEQAIDTSTGMVTATVSGKLAHLSGEEFSQNSVVTLTSGDGKSTNGSNVQKDGTFELANVPPGRYRLNAWTNGKHLFTAKLVASGAEVDHEWIKTSSTPAMIAATVYADPNLEVIGFARKNGEPAAGAMIVLIPQNPVDNRDLFRRDQSDSDGSFDLRDVIPGKYTVVAIEDGWTLNWAEPEVIAHYLPQGRCVTVSERNAQTTALKEAVPVQAK